jgi:hypothetical protein
MNNPIIQEVRAVRETLAAKFDFDLHRIIADAIRRQGDEHTVNRQSGLSNKHQHAEGAVVREEPPNH